MMMFSRRTLHAVYAIKKFMFSLSLNFILVPKWKLIYQCLLPLLLRGMQICVLYVCDIKCTQTATHSVNYLLTCLYSISKVLHG
jgi:hypothetical protein